MEVEKRPALQGGVVSLCYPSHSAQGVCNKFSEMLPRSFETLAIKTGLSMRVNFGRLILLNNGNVGKLLPLGEFEKVLEKASGGRGQGACLETE